MQVSTESTTGLERKLTIEIPSEVVDQEVDKRLKEAAKTVKINGFRAGKVPVKVVKQRYGAGIRQEVVGDTINKSFYDAVTQESLKPAGQPSIEPKELEAGKNLSFVATFEVYPEIESVVLDGIEIKKLEADITDEDVNKTIESLRKNQATFETVERAAQDGDRVNINFKGTKDGEAFDGGEANDQNLELGSKSMIPGFEDGIVGMSEGDTKTVSVTFPEDYQDESLKGAAADFEITVNVVEAQKLPELNDEFFAKFGQNDGGEDKFRTDVRENMEREKEKAIKGKLKQQVMDVVLEKNEIDIPKALVASEINALRDQMGNQMMQQYGQQASNIDFKSILPDNMFEDQAKKRVALGLVVSEIVKVNKIEADKEIVKKLIDDVASTYESPQEVVNHYYGNQELLSGVEAAAIEDQVVDFVLNQAKVETESVSYEEAIKNNQQAG